MNKNWKSKGEASTKEIIAVITLIVSFVVILIFLFTADLGKTSEEEICRNSVVMKGSPVAPSELIPLDCKTSYICITQDGSCEIMTNAKEEKVKTKEEVYKLLAEHMANCWSMFGEGNIEYVGKDFLPKNLYCSICYDVGFDDSVKKISGLSSGKIDKKDFYSYLSENKVPGKDITYLEYMSGIKKSQNLIEALSSNNVDFGTINLDTRQLIITGITAKVSVLGYIGIGVAAAGAAAIYFISAPASLPVTVGLIIKSAAVAGAAVVGGGAGYLAGTTVQGVSGNDYLTPTIVEADSETYKSLKCEDTNTLA